MASNNNLKTSVRFMLLLCFFYHIAVYGENNIEMSIDDVISVFYQRNLDLISAQYNIDQARAEQLIAGAIPNPSISIQLSEISNAPNRGSGAVGCNPNVSCGIAEYFSFSQLIELAGQRGLRIQSSHLAALAAESDFKDAERIFTNLLRNYYYNLLQMQKNRQLAKEIVDHYKDILRLTKLRLDKGDISESDYIRMRLEATHAESDLDSAETALEQSQSKLAMLLRLPDNSLNFSVKEDWPDFKYLESIQLSKDAFIELANKHRPDLEADKQRVSQAKKELELARRLNYPDVTLSAGYARDPSNNNIDSGFIGFSVPIPLFYQHKGELGKATTNLNQNQLSVEQTMLKVRDEVISALATWVNTNKAVKRYENGLLDDAYSIRKSIELSYSLGSTSILDLIESERNYKNIKHEYTTTLINRAIAYYDLVKALGIFTYKAVIDDD